MATGCSTETGCKARRSSSRRASSSRSSRSVLIEHLLYALGIARLGERELCEDARLARVELARCDEAELVVFDLGIAHHASALEPSAANHEDAVLRRLREGVERGLRHVAVANTGDDDRFRTAL